jgi:hypothetical protein
VRVIEEQQVDVDGHYHVTDFRAESKRWVRIEVTRKEVLEESEVGVEEQKFEEI